MSLTKVTGGMGVNEDGQIHFELVRDDNGASIFAHVHTRRNSLQLAAQVMVARGFMNQHGAWIGEPLSEAEVPLAALSLPRKP